MDAQAAAVFFGFFADLPDPRRHNVRHLFTDILTIAILALNLYWGTRYDGKQIQRWGEPREDEAANTPRSVLAKATGYFRNHREQVDYPAYRAKGWPIGSGITESGVKLFGKRVKGIEQFWNVSGAEAILALRSKWLSEDEESKYYWLGRGSTAVAA